MMRRFWLFILTIFLTMIQIASGQDDIPERLEISGHVDDYYNGIYYQTEDWGGVAHFEKQDGDEAHLFYYEDGGYWQLDFNDQDPDTPVEDNFDGGYAEGDPYYLYLDGEVYWSTSNYMNFLFGYPNELYGYDLPYTEQVVISNHVDDHYNGVFFRMEDWNGHAHFGKDDRTGAGAAHLFYFDAGFGYWQLDKTEQNQNDAVPGRQDLYDGGYAIGNEDYYQVFIGELNWSTQNSFVTFQHNLVNPDQSIRDLGPDLSDGAIIVTVSNHQDDLYNADYYQAEDWGEYEHFTTEDRSLHLFYFDHGDGYWQLDYRNQDGTRDYYDGGYAALGINYETDLIGQHDWVGSSTPVKFTSRTNGEEIAENPAIAFVDITQHIDDYYNGRYWQEEDWFGFAHFIKEDCTAHLYYIGSVTGYWNLDFRDQSQEIETQDWYNGGYISGNWDYTTVLNGEVELSLEESVAVFTWGEDEFEVESICEVNEEEPIEVDYVWYIIIEGHEDYYYNGVYERAEDDWNGYPHFAKADRSAHLYYYDLGSGFWQLDYREQDGRYDYYDGGFYFAGPQLTYISNTVEWTSPAIPLEMTQGFEEYDCQHCPEEEEGQKLYIEISNHVSSYYNGQYFLVEKWNGFPHFATNDRRAHLFYIEQRGLGFWQLDYREQDGTQDYYQGGYIVEEDISNWQSTLSGEVTVSGQEDAIYMEMLYKESIVAGENEIAVMTIENHIDEFYNGVYYQAEDWNGNSHFAKEDRSAHLYFYEWVHPDGFWQLDFNEQDSSGEIADLYHGGYTYAEPYIEELEGVVEWTQEDEEWNETFFDLTFTYEIRDISESPW